MIIKLHQLRSVVTENLKVNKKPYKHQSQVTGNLTELKFNKKQIKITALTFGLV